MKATAKKTISLFFLLLGIIPLVFTFFLLLKEGSIHRRMKEKMSESRALETIRLAEQDVIWMDKHEIWVNNSMFDIHDKKLENGFYTFIGMYDEEETELVNKEKALSENKQQEDKDLSLLIEQLKNTFHDCFGETCFFSSRKTSYPLTNALGPVSLFREILLPPPRRVA